MNDKNLKCESELKKRTRFMYLKEKTELYETILANHNEIVNSIF